MPRKASSEPLTRVGIAMYERDWSRLCALYPAKGASAVMRALVRNHLLKVDAAFSALEEAVPEIKINLSQEDFA